MAQKLICKLIGIPELTEEELKYVLCLDPVTNKYCGGNKGIFLRLSYVKEAKAKVRFAGDPLVEDAIAEVWGNYHMLVSDRRLKFVVSDIE